MFDREFFGAILPEHVRRSLAAHDDKTAIVEVHLGDRTVLDLCHVVRLDDKWVALAHYCRDDPHDDVDIAFVPYATIVRVSLTLRSNAERDMGFQMHSEPAGGTAAPLNG
jgi:cell wall assembly regulator SMI1